MHQHTWKHGTACGRTWGFCAQTPKRVHMGHGCGSSREQGWMCASGVGPGLKACVSMAGGMTHAPGMGTQAVCQQYSSWAEESYRRPEPGEERVKWPPLFPVPTCQEVGASKVLAGPRGLPTVNTGDSAALDCFPPVPRSGVSTWRRMLRAVGHLAELPGSRSKNVEADSFTSQGPHPRRAKARRCTGHAGELVIPVPTNCVHMR